MQNMQAQQTNYFSSSAETVGRLRVRMIDQALGSLPLAGAKWLVLENCLLADRAVAGS